MTGGGKACTGGGGRAERRGFGVGTGLGEDFGQKEGTLAGEENKESTK